MSLDTLLDRADIWRGDHSSHAVQKAMPTGFASLDEKLPGGGWPVGALTEILLPQEGIGELRLVMPALAQLSHEKRWVAWIAPPHIPYAPALAAYGIDLSRTLIVRPRATTDGFWAVEQALRSGTCAAVLAWPAGGDWQTLRRLQLAAEAGQSWGVLFRDERTAMHSSPAAARLYLEPLPGGIEVHVLKRRGSWATGPVVLNL